MLAVLLEAGVVPDVIVGTSAGALNGAAIAQEPTLAQAQRLERYYRQLATRDVFPFPTFALTARLLRGGGHLLPDTGLRRLISDWLDVDDLRNLRVPLHVTTTSLSDGRQRIHTAGDPTPILLASASIPGLFPPVRLADGHLHVDGGVSANVPVAHALTLNPSQVWVLDLSPTLDVEEEPLTASAVVAVCLAAVMQAQDSCWADDVRVRRIRVGHVGKGLLGGAANFGHAGELIAAGRAAAEDALRDAGLLEVASAS